MGQAIVGTQGGGAGPHLVVEEVGDGLRRRVAVGPHVVVAADLDVRDLADWTIRALESGASGAFNATGPQGRGPLDWPTFLRACSKAAARRGAAPLATVPVDEAFLLEQGVVPWTELPLWVPSSDPQHLGFDRVDCSRAIAAGLATRPLAETIEAVLDEAPSLVDEDRRHRGKLSRSREHELIARWRERGSSHASAHAVEVGTP